MSIFSLASLIQISDYSRERWLFLTAQERAVFFSFFIFSKWSEDDAVESDG